MTPSALWTAAHHQIPLLVVMDNNRAYGNSVEHAESIARLRGRSETNRGVSTTIREPDVDFAGLARAFGMEAFGPIHQNCDLAPVLDNAVRVVTEERRPVLVDVVTDSTTHG
jgi:acetolactate synthase-1/2/3 large subunit